MDNRGWLKGSGKAQVVRTETGGAYRLIRELPGGGRGQTFLASVIKKPHNVRGKLRGPLARGSLVVVKLAKADWSDNSAEIANFVTVANASLSAEINAISRLNGLKGVAGTVDFGTVTTYLPDGTPLRRNFVVQKYIDGPSLKSFMEEERPNGATSADEWFRFAVALTTIVEAFHQRGIIHKDLWPTNVILNSGEPVVIDFGESAFRQATSFPILPKTVHLHPYMAPEDRSSKGWPSPRGDLYSLGAILFYYATGQNPPLWLPTNDDELKLDIFHRISARNPGLVAANFGIPDIIARCLRSSLDSRVPDAEHLLQEIITFEGIPIGLPEAIASAVRKARQIQRANNRLLTTIAAVKIRKLDTVLSQILQEMLDVDRDREEIAATLVQHLSVLTKGDEYLAVSVPQTWFGNNLGINGRCLAMNRVLAGRGVLLRRVFLLTDADRGDERVNEVLVGQLELCKHLNGNRLANVDIRYSLVRSEVQERAIREGRDYGISISGDVAMKVVPVFDTHNEVITSIRLRRTGAVQADIREHFMREFGEAIPLEKWFTTGNRTIRLQG